MKMSLEWHKQCLENRLENYRTRERILSEAIDRHRRSRLENEFYQDQITEAIARGLDSFDSDRLLKARRRSKK